MDNRIFVALHRLSPQGLALKRHILHRLQEAAPDSLIAAEVRRGGPSRNPGSVTYALRALQRIGAVEFLPRDCPYKNDRWRLKPAANDAVREFLKEAPQDEQIAVVPLPLTDRHRTILGLLRGSPNRSFAVSELTNKIPGSNETTIRKHAMQLFEAGHVLRTLSDSSKPGIPRYVFQLNPAAEHFYRTQIE